MRICIVYDCLFPFTVGGAERWYRGLAERLAAAGHDVTYVTRTQWDAGTDPSVAGVRVLGVSPGGPLYHADGRRLVGPPLRFGLGVLRHLLGARGSYDAVHLCSFPYFSLLAARLALAGTRVRVGVDWFEVWTREYWAGYLGRLGGTVGWLVQRLCARLTPQAFVFSELHAARLRGEGLPGAALRLDGLYDGALEPAPAAAADPPVVVFAGRHIPEKRAELVAPAIAVARERLPELRGLILGDGPEHERVVASIAGAGLNGVVTAPGFRSSEEVGAALGSAACLLLPSAREGYGLVVVEAAAQGTPSVVVAGPDNAAVELIEEGVNGHVAESAAPAAIAAAVVRCVEGGPALRERTANWFASNAAGLTLDESFRHVAEWYSGAAR